MTDKNCTITTYKPSDGEYIAEHMREMDVFECKATGFDSPLEAIRDGFEASVNMMTGCYKGVPACIWGEVPDDHGGAVIWQLGTDAVRQHKKIFMVESRKVIQAMLKRYEYLTNVVCMDNRESVRWLEWLGAKFMLKDTMVLGRPFARFYITRGDE